jgi:hypothetical protein
MKEQAMTLIGTVVRVPCARYSFVQVTPTEEYFAHKNEYSSPELMEVGTRVKFTSVPTHQGPQAFQIEAA